MTTAAFLAAFLAHAMPVSAQSNAAFSTAPGQVSSQIGLHLTDAGGGRVLPALAAGYAYETYRSDGGYESGFRANDYFSVNQNYNGRGYTSLHQYGYVTFGINELSRPVYPGVLSAVTGEVRGDPTVTFTAFVGNASTMGPEAGFAAVRQSALTGNVFYQMSLAGNSSHATRTAAPSPSFYTFLESAVASGATTITMVASSSPRGAGVPSPVAGAGLPFLAFAWLAWRRGRGRRIKAQRLGHAGA